MTKERRSKNSSSNNVKSYRHEKDTRKNVMPVGLASYDTVKPKPKKYKYDPHLAPRYSAKFSSSLLLSAYQRERFRNESI